MTILNELAKHALSKWNAPFPDDVAEQAAIFFDDAAVCMILGCKSPAVRITAEYAREDAASGLCTIIGTNEKTSMETAAMINGVAGHFDDYDDTMLFMKGHPSVVLIPVVLAVGESLHSPGIDLLRAYSVGLDICAAVGLALSDNSFKRTWHNTSALGVFGAAAAAGVMMGLDEQQLTLALGIAASESGGLMANFGTMTSRCTQAALPQRALCARGLQNWGLNPARTLLTDSPAPSPAA